MAIQWKRLDYLVHRWIGIALGALVFVWFVSGIILIYYPWPAPTSTATRARLHAFEVPVDLIGFRAAHRAVAQANPAIASTLVGGQLLEWNGRLTYVLWRLHRYQDQPTVMVDARTAQLISPIPESSAVAEARSVVGALPDVQHVSLLERGDHYLLASEYQPGFPAYQVQFDDPAHTAVYVSRDGGYVVGIVTTLTRWTTWLGTVPHWLYFKWLYQRRIELWLWVSYILPAVTLVGAMTGITMGVWQLFPRRRRGEWRISAYQGISKWHHISGVVFGLVVFLWTLSGLLEVIGPENFPVREQVIRVRGATVPWDTIPVSEADATRHLADSLGAPVLPIAVDLTSLDDRPGYVFHLQGERVWWVDAITGVPRRELDANTAAAIGERAAGDHAPVRTVERLTRYDAYYYARPFREMQLPVWRVALDDPQRSTMYLDPVTGNPVGFLDTEARVYRWLRDGLHSADYPGVNNKRPLWDLILLPLMIGGTIVAFSGVWLLIRRLRRMT